MFHYVNRLEQEKEEKEHAKRTMVMEQRFGYSYWDIVFPLHTYVDSHESVVTLEGDTIKTISSLGTFFRRRHYLL